MMQQNASGGIASAGAGATAAANPIGEPSSATAAPRPVKFHTCWTNSEEGCQKQRQCRAVANEASFAPLVLLRSKPRDFNGAD
jgi:hypothetical protein